MRLVASSLAAVVGVALLVQSARAAPLRDIRKPPTWQVPSWTGPPVDPHAQRGQWFMDIAPSGTEPEFTFRTHEFYDNVRQELSGGTHGGGFAGTGAIRGTVQNVVQNALGNVTDFEIRATITNDLPGRGEGRQGSNSHDEQWMEEEKQLPLPLLGVKLTAEFAIDPAQPAPDPWTGAYRPPDLPSIKAMNHDEAAWYCWTPDNPWDTHVPWGGYTVPTWDFGDILPGGSATEIMKFKVSGAGITADDPRYEVLQDDRDVLLNRTTSLKVSTWVDALGFDDGTPYPGFMVPPSPPFRSSDVSVFCNVPEPSTWVMLLGAGAMGVLALVRRRRRRES